jgi:L-fucose isomerase-like protein
MVYNIVVGLASAASAALVAFGEVNSPRWLLDEKAQRARAALEAAGLSVVDIGVVTDEPSRAEVDNARTSLTRTDFDLLVICVVGWIPSQPVIDVAEAARDRPMVLWGLSGSTIDGRLVSTADQAGTTALRHPMVQLGYRFTYVHDRADRVGEGAEQIVGLAQVAAAAKQLRRARIGSMGYRDMNLYATLLDPAALRRELGVEVEVFELHEVAQAIRAASSPDVADIIDWMKDHWTFARPLAETDETLEIGARMYLAIRDKAVERSFDAITLIDCSGTKKLLQFPPGIVMALLSDLGGYAAIPENDIAGATTQLLVRSLTGQTGAYFEFYEFLDDERLLMGVPDFVPAEVVDGDVRVLPWPGFGGLRGGLLNVSKVKAGPVTLCRLGPHGSSGFQLHVALGTAHAARSWEEAGWDAPAPQLAGIEIELVDTTLDAFADRVLGQHYILAYGDHRNALGALCKHLGISQS